MAEKLKTANKDRTGKSCYESDSNPLGLHLSVEKIVYPQSCIPLGMQPTAKKLLKLWQTRLHKYIFIPFLQ